MPETSPREVAYRQSLTLLKTVDSKLGVVRAEILEIDREMQKLKDRRAVLASERERLSKIKREPRTFEDRIGADQGLFVHTRYFLDAVKEWIDKYDAEHGKGGKRALQMLSGVHAKSVRGYFNGRITYAGILSVDRILTAIGREDLLDDMPWKEPKEIFGPKEKRVAEINERPASHFYED